MTPFPRTLLPLLLLVAALLLPGTPLCAGGDTSEDGIRVTLNGQTLTGTRDRYSGSPAQLDVSLYRPGDVALVQVSRVTFDKAEELGGFISPELLFFNEDNVFYEVRGREMIAIRNAAPREIEFLRDWAWKAENSPIRKANRRKPDAFYLQVGTSTPHFVARKADTRIRALAEGHRGLYRDLAEEYGIVADEADVRIADPESGVARYWKDEEGNERGALSRSDEAVAAFTAFFDKLRGAQAQPGDGSILASLDNAFAKSFQTLDELYAADKEEE